MNKLLGILTVFGTVVSLSSFAQSAPGYTKLFTLERSNNKNQVVYEVNPANTNNPVHAYRIMLEDDGHTEELTRLERNRAYGTTVVSQSNTEIVFTIKAFQSHPLTVKFDPDTKVPYATIALPDGDKILKDIFLTLTGGLIPGVRLVDIYYENQKDGPLLKETFDPKNI